jgi:hypothetical protein
MQLGLLIPGIVLLIVILFFILKVLQDKYSKNGFIDLESDVAGIGHAIAACAKTGHAGHDLSPLLGNDHHIHDETQDMSVEASDSGLPFANSLICEKVTTITDCSAFDSEEFKKANCALCLDIGGKDNIGRPHIGGKAIQTRLGKEAILFGRSFCPAGKLVTTKKECEKLMNIMRCRQSKTLDDSGCSQCYNTGEFTYIDSDSISGSGTFYLVGSGNLKIIQRVNNIIKEDKIRLSIGSGDPYSFNIQVEEGNTIEMTVTPIDTRTPPYIAGYLTGQTMHNNGNFFNDLKDLSVDNGGQPSVNGIVKVNGKAVSKIVGKTQKIQYTILTEPVNILPQNIVLTVQIPFSFVRVESEDAQVCKTSPFLTKRSSSEFLQSNPCYTNGSGPGNYSAKCLQGIWISNGCSSSGKFYPGDTASSNNLMEMTKRVLGKNADLTDIAAYIYNRAIMASSGIDSGRTLTREEWLDANEFCTGETLKTLCDSKFEVSPLCNEPAEPCPSGSTQLISKKIKLDDFPRNKGNIIQSGFKMSRNFELTLMIEPLGIVGDWASIIHFSNGADANAYGNRAPGIWFPPGRIDTFAVHIDHMKANGLALRPVVNSMRIGKISTFVLRCIDNQITIMVDGIQCNSNPNNTEETCSRILKGKGLRYNGELTVYCPDPWYQPANCKIHGICFKNLTETESEAKTVCVSGFKFTKLGDFKLGFLDTNPQYIMNKPEYKDGQWIFTANKDNWMKMTEGQRNETWAMVVLSPNKSNGENVSEITIEVAKKNNIGERISQETMFFNYLLKHKTKDSSIILQKCGYINAWNEDIASIVGMYIGNNWSTQYKATHGQFVKNIEGKSTGVPHINEEYELYYAVSTDFC